MLIHFLSGHPIALSKDQQPVRAPFNSTAVVLSACVWLLHLIAAHTHSFDLSPRHDTQMDDAQVADHVAAGLANYTKERLAQAQVLSLPCLWPFHS
jgi:hypothetical protein